MHQKASFSVHSKRVCNLFLMDLIVYCFIHYTLRVRWGCARLLLNPVPSHPPPPPPSPTHPSSSPLTASYFGHIQTRSFFAGRIKTFAEVNALSWFNIRTLVSWQTRGLDLRGPVCESLIRIMQVSCVSLLSNDRPVGVQQRQPSNGPLANQRGNGDVAVNSSLMWPLPTKRISTALTRQTIIPTPILWCHQGVCWSASLLHPLRVVVMVTVCNNSCPLLCSGLQLWPWGKESEGRKKKERHRKKERYS